MTLCIIIDWHEEEKFDADHSWGLKGWGWKQMVKASSKLINKATNGSQNSGQITRRGNRIEEIKWLIDQSFGQRKDTAIMRWRQSHKEGSTALHFHEGIHTFDMFLAIVHNQRRWHKRRRKHDFIATLLAEVFFLSFWPLRFVVYSRLSFTLNVSSLPRKTSATRR